MREERRAAVPERLRGAGGLAPGVARELARETGVPEAEIHGIGSFYHLLARPNVQVRVCTGLACRLAGADAVLDAAAAAGLSAEGCACLAACDAAPAVLRGRSVLPAVDPVDVRRSAGEWKELRSQDALAGGAWTGHVGPEGPESRVFDLGGEPDWSGRARQRAQELGPDAVVALLAASGLQGRGGAGFPAHVKWSAVRAQPEATRYVVLNADEGEPGTFKDRELLLRRPDRVLEGLAIAADAIGARHVYVYMRGEFEWPRRALARAVEAQRGRGALDGLDVHLHSGHGAYIAGEETALLEALEGRRALPRQKPPFPGERGLWGAPTLMHNVETIAAIPPIVLRGGDWFRSLGRTEPGTKLYCVSGHVARPGTYELPLGVCLDELAEAAGGYVGSLKAFSPGGASSGFLPASERARPLDYGSLRAVGSTLGTAGVVVLDDTVDLRWAAATQLRFFEAESCGQCAPCRIGTRLLRESLERQIAEGGTDALAHVAEVAWQMREGSICGLGHAAPLPLTSALAHFPEDFAR